MPNIILNGLSGVSGFVDWGRAGIADRYQDLALAARSIRDNCGPAWAERFLSDYGLRDPDWAKIEWYQVLDEFF
jgi:kanamycin kinase/aminoglycoside 3'-phosphotransferase-2